MNAAERLLADHPELVTSQIRNRFESKIDRNGPVPIHRPELGPCWLWLATKRTRGYGGFKVLGMVLMAHRFSYIIHVGPIADGLYVLHHCDNQSCVRPDHFFVGTPRDNVADMFEKGRAPREFGEFNPQAKLREVDIPEIRAQIRNGLATQQELADRYGVRQTTIQAVVCRRSWNHVA